MAITPPIGGMMFKHVTMTQPHAGVICDKDQFSLFVGLHQIGITQKPAWRFAKLPALHPEMVPVQVHRVLPA